MAPAQDNAMDWVMWPSCIMHLPLSEQLDATKAGNFTSLAIAPATIKRELKAGARISDLLEQAAERGLRFSHLDGISTWASIWYPSAGDHDLNAAMRVRFDVSVEEALDFGQALGVSSAVAVGAFDAGLIGIDELVPSYAAFCDAAKAHGIEVHLEFIPLWGIRELPMAWDIVRQAQRSNSGIVLDTWHMQMGSSDFERDIRLLEQIPGTFLRHVQLADADQPLQTRSLASQVMLRKFPGDGSLDISRMLSIVDAKGGLASVGPEIVGSALEGLNLSEIGIRSRETSRSALARARERSIIGP
jgi:sugar phosphate isomerase/epimerase